MSSVLPMTIVQESNHANIFPSFPILLEPGESCGTSQKDRNSELSSLLALTHANKSWMHKAV